MTCPSRFASSGVGQFKRRCAEPFTCRSGRLMIQPNVNYGCKCSTEDNAAIADCQICEHRAGEHGQHCQRCNGGGFLWENRCTRQNCDDLVGMVEYTPGTYGRECRSPFICADRADEDGRDCKCPQAVGKTDCRVCEFGSSGAFCLQCTNGKVRSTADILRPPSPIPFVHPTGGTPWTVVPRRWMRVAVTGQ